MIKRIVMMEGGVETLSYFSHQMAGEFQKLGYAVFFYDLKQEESSAGKLRKFIRPRETVLVTFNFQGLEKEAGVYREGIGYLWDTYHIPCYNIAADHPYFYYEQSVVEDLAKWSGVPVWNGLTDADHPTQILADLMTIEEHCKKPLNKIKVVFPGDVRNNMCYAWMMGAAKLGMHFVAMGPEELAKQMDQEVVQSTFAEARKNGGLIEITDHAEDLKGADVIYGDVWASMGEEAQIPERVGLLSPFRVTMDTLKATENPDVLYLHCLPSFHDFETKMAKEWQAKGVDIREVTDEVFRSRHSVVFDEAENRMHSIKAVMVATIGA